MAKHDESKDLRLVGRICEINWVDKSIQANPKSILGIHTLGRIDFLTHYCGWRFYYNNGVAIGGVYNKPENTTEVKQTNIRKAAKERALTDKTKKTSKKR